MTLTEVRAMTPEEKRVKLAELLGWCIEAEEEDGALMGTFPIEGSRVGGWDMVPDYCNDLNAVHEVRRRLEPRQRWKYVGHLENIVRHNAAEVGWSFALIDAKPEHHTESLILTLSV